MYSERPQNLNIQFGFDTGIDLTKRKSHVHFFELQVETKKNLKLLAFFTHPHPLRKIVMFVLEGWETGTEITEAKDFSFTLVWSRKKTEFVLFSTIFYLHQNSNFLGAKIKLRKIKHC